MTKTTGRKPTYPFGAMEVNDTLDVPVPTLADTKRMARNTSQYGLRNDRFYRCSTDRATRIMTITRIR